MNCRKLLVYSPFLCLLIILRLRTTQCHVLSVIARQRPSVRTHHQDRDRLNSVDDLGDAFRELAKGAERAVGYAWSKQQHFLLSHGVSKAQQRFLVPQLSLALLVVIGGVPFVQSAIESCAGAALLTTGVAFFIGGAQELGGSFSAYGRPVRRNVLKTTGVFSLCRHPMYTGAVFSAGGLALLTHSSARLSLAIALAVVLDQKADEEEVYLEAFHPEYTDYKYRTYKFIPYLH